MPSKPGDANNWLEKSGPNNAWKRVDLFLVQLHDGSGVPPSNSLRLTQYEEVNSLASTASNIMCLLKAHW